MRDLRTLRVEFDQEKHLRILRRPRVSKGTALMDGRRLLLTVTDAKDRRETELLVDDGEVRIHYPKLRKLEIFPADASTKRKPPFPMIVDDIEQLTRDNELSLERDGTAKILVMEPRDKSSQFERIRIRFESGQMKRIEQSSRRGDRVVLRISKFTVNPKIDPKTLRLDVPRGTKVERIGAAPAKK